MPVFESVERNPSMALWAGRRPLRRCALRHAFTQDYRARFGPPEAHAIPIVTESHAAALKESLNAF